MEHILSTVPRVARGERKPGQKLITFYVPAAEREAFMEAVRANDETATAVLRRAVTAYVKRAERKQASEQ